MYGFGFYLFFSIISIWAHGSVVGEGADCHVHSISKFFARLTKSFPPLRDSWFATLPVREGELIDLSVDHKQLYGLSAHPNCFLAVLYCSHMVSLYMHMRI